MGNITNRQRINKHISEGVSKLTPENIQKLEQLYSLDASLGEMCSYLDVSDQTIYNWKKANPELFGKLERMRDKPTLKARQTVIQKFSESYQNAMDYLKRKKKLEFGDSIKTEIDGKLEISGVEIKVRE
jgi:predicted DNA-binding protein YlxM (UPF0122 family)